MTVGRFPVGVFVLISAAGLVMGCRAIAAPETFLAMLPAVSGIDAIAIAARDEEAASALGFLGRWVGTALLGANGITLLLALSTYRQGNRATWWAFWYWPALFASHAFMYVPGTPMWYLQFVNLGLSSAAQVVAWRRATGAAGRRD